MSDQFIDENAAWPLWRPLLGTVAGALVLMFWCSFSPVDVSLPYSDMAYGALFGRTALIFGLLYFPAYSRRGWPWRIAAFLILFAAAFVANLSAPGHAVETRVETTR